MRGFGSWFGQPERGVEQSVTPAPFGNVGEDVVAGERGNTLASRARSLQARLNALLAGAFVIGIVIAMFAWYYGVALRHAGHQPRVASGASSSAGGVGPPPLGSIPAPQGHPAAPVVQLAHGSGAIAHREASDQDLAVSLPTLARSQSRFRQARSGDGVTNAEAVLRGAGSAREFSGSVFIAAHRSTPARGLNVVSATASHSGARLGTEDTSGVSLHSLLSPSVMSATQAQLLPQRRLLLAKGTFIDCTLETAIDSTLPGMTTCITSTDTFSADGTVVLLPRGTQLIGQTRGEVRQGMARVFVIWTQARTPSGVVVRLDSPATDSLGRSGLGGKVNRHFWQRFGAALLISSLTGVIQSRVERSAGAVIIDPTASEDVLTQALTSAQDIAPTVEVPNGQRIEVLVARDVDFAPVYELAVH